MTQAFREAQMKEKLQRYPKVWGREAVCVRCLWLPGGNTPQHVTTAEQLVPLATHSCLPSVGEEACAADSFINQLIPLTFRGRINVLCVTGA